MLSFIIWFPILTALVLFALPIQDSRLARWLALVPACAMVVASIALFHGAAVADPSSLPAFEVCHDWAPEQGIMYHLGVTELSALLILLTALVGAAAIGVSQVATHARHFYALGLLMIGGLAGAFASLDLFSFYIFHELALIPTFILIGLWGAERRRQAAMKITLYLAFGSVILLIGLIALYLRAGGETFDLPALRHKLAITPLDAPFQIRLFGVFLLGFGILISAFPFHTWAPMGYGEAPPLAAMLHAGVIKKFGLYGLFAVAIPLLPAGFEWWKPWIIVMAIGNLIYCGYVAMQQRDLRYMLAYSSVSHMGYALLALAAATPVATQGFALFLFAHGLSAALAFGVAGHCREQTGSTDLSDLGGLARRMPLAATLFTIAAFAACGLPGLANFPAELMIFLGSFQSHRWATIAALWTVVISSVYMLRAVRNIFLGPLNEKRAAIQDLTLGRRVALMLLVAALLITGFWPRCIAPKSSNAAACLVLKP